METIGGHTVIATAKNGKENVIYLIAHRITHHSCVYWWIGADAKKVFHRGDGTMESAFARARNGGYKLQKRKRKLDASVAVGRMAFLYVGIDFYSLSPREREIADLLSELKLLVRDDRGILIAPIVAARGK